MTKRIFTQELGVSQHRDRVGNEALVYTPKPLLEDGSPAPEASYKRIDSDVLNGRIEDVRRRVEELTSLARLGHDRGNVGIEREASALSSYVLPEGGFVSVIPPEIHPRFDIINDAAQEIPWEVLQEYFGRCACGAPTVCLAKSNDSSQASFCSVCGSPLQVAGGRLAVDRHLAHLVRGGRASTNVGNEFLIIVDPRSDLTTEGDPSGECQRHIQQLTQMLTEHNFRINLIKKKNATLPRVREALGRKSVVGMYYFGHGYFPHDGNEGRLLLADDGVLVASEIQELEPGIRFVFLNACEGAATGRNWTLERKLASVGHAFARGGPTKAVIAPLWPVVNTQAATFALEFFKQALGGSSLGEALCSARKESLARYDAGSADISWMAYRFFGDPNRNLPEPVEPAAVGDNAVAPSQLFAEKDRLNADLFAFDLRGVLLRAAKRRNLQERSWISTADVLAGMVRTGQFTRYVCRSLGIEPDRLYSQLLETHDAPVEEGSALPQTESLSETESDADASPSQQKLAELLREFEKLYVRHTSQFSQRLHEVLRAAERHMASAEDENQAAEISEKALLVSLMNERGWVVPLTASLPPVHKVRQFLQSDASRRVDDNGQLTLAELTPEARRIVEHAHELSQQRGMPELSSRLLLAAFLSDEAQVAALCDMQGCDSGTLATLLIASADSKTPSTFVLSPESATRVLLPAINRAMAARPDRQPVDEQTLFQAFCVTAPPPLKKALKGFEKPLGLDLDAVARARLSQSKPADRGQAKQENASASADSRSSGGPSSLTGLRCEANVESILNRAFASANAQGYRELTSIHLLIGAIAGGSGILAECLRQFGVRPEEAVVTLGGFVRPKSWDPANTRPAVSKNSEQALQLAAKRMHAQGRSTINEWDLWCGLLEKPVASVHAALTQLDVVELLDILRNHEAESPTDSVINRVPFSIVFDLSAQASKGTVRNFVGRHNVLSDVVRHLDESQGVVLVGGAGVGKSMCADGLASWLQDGLCPEPLRGRRVMELPVRSLVQSRQLCWHLDDLVQQLLSEMTAEDIVFVDDIDALLSPFISGPQMLERLLTPLADHPLVLTASSVAAVQACGRSVPRLQTLPTVTLEAPTRSQAQEILAANKDWLEARFGVEIDDEAMAAALELATSVAGEQSLPITAIEFLAAIGVSDESPSRIDRDAVERFFKPEEPLPST